VLTLEHFLLALTLLSALYWLGAVLCAAAFARRRLPTRGWTPPISVLKPLLRNDGQLYDNLRSFCEQDYPAFQVLFGVQDESDPAVPVVDRLVREFPHLDLRLVVNDRIIGPNRKISNVANLCREARHEVLVLADSDMRVGRDYLRAVVAPLEDKAVGLVTCLYRSAPRPGLGATLAAMFINEWFVPAVLVGSRVQPLRHAFGSTIACRRGPLAAIGGFEAVADYLADDYMLGSLISQRGLRVVLSPYIVENAGGERDLPGLFFRELRWTRTFRTMRPLSYFLSGITHGVPLSLLFLLSTGFSGLALIMTAAHLGLRGAGGLAVYSALGLPAPRGRLWLVPLRDGLSFVTWLLSFLGQSVRWNDRRLRVDANGKLHSLSEAGLPPPHPSSLPRG
jgi:ceramide glucosyltransferase